MWVIILMLKIDYLSNLLKYINVIIYAVYYKLYINQITIVYAIEKKLFIWFSFVIFSRFSFEVSTRV